MIYGALSSPCMSICVKEIQGNNETNTENKIKSLVVSKKKKEQAAVKQGTTVLWYFNPSKLKPIYCTSIFIYCV